MAVTELNDTFDRLRTRGLALFCLVYGMVFVSLQEVRAEILISLVETERGVELLGEGSANVKGLSFGADGLVGNSDFAFHFGSGMVRVGTPASVRVRQYSGIVGPNVFGSNEIGRIVSGSGDVVGVLPKRRLLILPAGYESGTSVFGRATYEEVTLAELGLAVGIYQWSWGTRPNGDTLTVRVDSDLHIPVNDRPLNLLQNGSFEQGSSTWESPHPMTIGRGEAHHGSNFLELQGVRLVEQIVNLFPGRYRLDFSFAPMEPRDSSVKLVLAEQGVASAPLVETTYTGTGQREGLFWRSRSLEFEVIERVGKLFGQMALRFLPVEMDLGEIPMETDSEEGLRLGILIDDVQIYRLGGSQRPLLTLRASFEGTNKIEILMGRPGRVQLEYSADLVDWFPFRDPIRVLRDSMEVQDVTGNRQPFRYYRGFYDSDIELRPIVPSNEGPELVWINPGTFVIGSDESDPDRDGDEGPLTTVTLSERYAIGTHEVTQSEYVSLMHVNPSRFQFDSSHPVSNVRWQQAMEYCRRLTEREESDGRLPSGHVYRLPTEAEWDFACRAGQSTRYHYGDDPDYSNLGTYAWYSANSDGVSQPVMTREPNDWGIFGMHGNVHEWCLDRYGPYSGGELTDPRGPEGDDDRSLHVIRGGSWFDTAKNCRRADRHRDWFVTYVGDLGFRVALAPRF
jgi:formylglycine-generating enzyme required for sulfatase activity